MTTRAMRILTTVGVLAWVAVAGYGVREMAVLDDAGWQAAYEVYSAALLIGAVVTVVLAAWLSRTPARPVLRLAGLAVCVLGCLAAVVAWAMALWMPILGAGFALLAVASTGPGRRASTLVAAGQLAGMASVIGMRMLEVGTPDSAGDYPYADGTGLILTAALTVVALVTLARLGRAQAIDPAPVAA